MKGNTGASRLARALTSHTKTLLPNELWLEFGTIVASEGSLGLKVDKRAAIYPPGAWFASEHLTAPDPMLVLTGTDSRGDTITINLTRPKILHPLQAGDRVLVALLHGGLDPVVVDRVTGPGVVTQ